MYPNQNPGETKSVWCISSGGFNSGCWTVTMWFASLWNVPWASWGKFLRHEVTVLSLWRARPCDTQYGWVRYESVWSLYNEGGYSWVVQAQGHLALGWLVESVKEHKVCLKGNGSDFPADDFLWREGCEHCLFSSGFKFSPPPSKSVGITSTGSKLICTQLSLFPLANMKK